MPCMILVLAMEGGVEVAGQRRSKVRLNVGVWEAEFIFVQQCHGRRWEVQNVLGFYYSFC